MAWFTPKCPVDPDEKEWVEECFIWLLQEFGAETLRELKTVLPTWEFFPDDFSADVPSLRKTLRRVCSFMNVNVEDVELRIFTDDGGISPHPLTPVNNNEFGACGLYRFYRGKHYISIETGLLGAPEKLIATLAHELCHARLIGEDRIDPDRQDQEFLTDLATIFFGFGVFTANTLFSFEQWTNSSFQGWQASRAGYLSEETAGYAIGLFAYIRGETNSVWKPFLKGSAKHFVKQTLNYLEKTHDTKLKRF